MWLEVLSETSTLNVLRKTLTLTAASVIVFIETNWSPSELDQAIARLDRKGQTEHVMAYILVVAGSMDDRVSSAIYRKRSDIDQIVA